jgi:PAS domain S-box-containing protein
MDSDRQERFDRLTRLASGLLKAPVALVSLVDAGRQYFVSEVGLEGLRQTPLSHSFCQHVVVDDAALVVYDARLDPRIQDNLAIRDLGVIAYAGVPLSTADGHTLGSFCVIDTSPREWSKDDLALLGDLAISVVSEIELHTANRELRSSEAQLTALIEHSPAAITLRGRDGRYLRVNSHLSTAIGRSAEEIVGLLPADLYPPEVATAVTQNDRVLRSGESVTSDVTFTHADGTSHRYELLQYPIRDADGTVTGFGTYGVDVTERRATPASRRDDADPNPSSP